MGKCGVFIPFHSHSRETSLANPIPILVGFPWEFPYYAHLYAEVADYGMGRQLFSWTVLSWSGYAV